MSDRYSVEEATRTENGKTRYGWIVERHGKNIRVAVSILFKTKEKAESEMERLEAVFPSA